MIEGHHVVASLLASYLAYCYLWSGSPDAGTRPLLLDDEGFLVREGLRFTLKVEYHGENEPTSLGVRGSGLGLCWEETRALTRCPEDPAVWSTDVVYKESAAKGFQCQDCPCEGAIPTHGRLEFKFYHTGSDGVERAEGGPAHTVKLPVSGASESNPSAPVFTFHPFFFSEEGTTMQLPVKSQTSKYVGTRSNLVYFPPGYSENPRPTYDVTYLIDAGSAFMSEEVVRPLLDKIFLSHSPDSVVIGFGDYDMSPDRQDAFMADRTELLTPSRGMLPLCKEGSLFDGCNGCTGLDFMTAEPEDAMKAWMGDCYERKPVGGRADETLDYLTSDVLDTLEGVMKKKGVSVPSRDRQRTSLVGYSLGGLISCYGALTRPEVFGKAGCMSSSFWWPLEFPEDKGPASLYETINKTVPAAAEKYSEKPRPPQRVLIDVGDKEESGAMKMTDPARQVFDALSSQPYFSADSNLWLKVYPGEKHGPAEFFRRLWNVFKTLAD